MLRTEFANVFGFGFFCVETSRSCDMGAVEFRAAAVKNRWFELVVN